MSEPLRVSAFDFTLPPELVAQEPPPQRGASRLMRLDAVSGRIAHHQFADLPRLLRAGDLLVMNDTKVFPARLIGERLPGGGAAECLLVRPADELPATAGATDELWLALANPGPRLRPGSRLRFVGAGGTLHAEVVRRTADGLRTVRLWTEDGTAVRAAVERLGHVPLPPYIRRGDVAADRDRYQTVIARHEGSVAAPTAGLHFTAHLLDALDRAGIERTTLTLHVGYGTFQPVRAEFVADHRMEAERYEVGAEAAAALTRARREGRRIVAVGTTTTRTLESLPIGPDGSIAPAQGATGLFIAPGYVFRMVNALVTNFHVPKSSLLMLVSAFAGVEHVRRAYETAIADRYRFYSYGDAMVIL